jgi:hypothetical protein
MKCVMVINRELPVGLIANTAAVLAVSLGKKIDGLVGEDVLDADGSVHPGITQAPIPILGGDGGLIHRLRQTLTQQAGDGVYYVDFCDVAQRSNRYDEYRAKLAAAPGEALAYLGIAICGPNKFVERLTGSIGLLK